MVRFPLLLAARILVPLLVLRHIATGFSYLRVRSGILAQDFRVPYGPFGAWGVGLDLSGLCLTLVYHANLSFSPIGF